MLIPGAKARAAQAPNRLARLAGKAAALAALSLTAPVFVCATLLILATDGAPVFFRQWRIGKDGEPFRIIKFRTMRAGGNGPSITSAGDSRITRVGAWLRALKVDELPQFLNVLEGDMAWIGPRPEAPQYVRYEDEVWRRVLQARPGLTGLAALAFRDEEAILARAADAENHYRAVVLPEKLKLNLYYQRSRNWASDARLLWMTAWYSLFPRAFERSKVLRSFCSGTGEPT